MEVAGVHLLNPPERLPQLFRTRPCAPEREFFIDNLLVRIHFIIVMVRWTGLAPWEFEFPFSGSLTSAPNIILTSAVVTRDVGGTRDHKA